MMQYPFRILAVVLTILIGIEVVMLLILPDYSNEVEAAKAAYLKAYARNLELRRELEAVIDR